MQRVRKIRETTSKKDPTVRRAELITPISPLFLHAIESHASDITSNSFGCVFITEVIIDGIGEKQAAVNAVANAVQGDPLAPGHAAHSPFAGKMLKTLIAGGRFDRSSGKVMPLDPPLHFPELLFGAIEPNLEGWVLGDGGFVVLALLEATWKDKEGAKKVQNAVKSSKVELERNIKEGEDLDKSKEADFEDGLGKRRRATAAKLLLDAVGR